MSADCQNVTLYAGDDAAFGVPVLDETGAPLPLIGASFAYTIATDEGETALVTKTVGNGVTVTDPANGLLTIAIGHADTLTFLGPMWHQLVMTDASGDVSTLMTGTLTFKARS